MKKNKDNTQFICYLISLLFIIMSNWLLDNLAVSIFNGLVFFYVIYKDIVLTYKQVTNRVDTHEKFRQFANGLIMQLSVTPNINDAFKQIASMNKEEYSDVLLDDSLMIEEKLDSLEAIFPIPLFHILKHILLLYVEQGGNILDMSQELLNKCDLELSNMQEIFSLNKHKWSESIIMWGFAILGFIYLRSALISYYLTLTENLTFVICIEVFLLIFVMSLKLSSNKYLKEQIEL